MNKMRAGSNGRVRERKQRGRARKGQGKGQKPNTKSTEAGAQRSRRREKPRVPDKVGISDRDTWGSQRRFPELKRGHPILLERAHY
jgi:hypothetical protein